MALTHAPFVSVIVPVHNGAETIGSCLEALVSQDYPRDRYEVIVVDNRSTDATAAVIQRYPVTYVTERAVQSSYAARNRGIGESRGELLAFTDADCIPASDWLRQGVAGFASARVGCVAGQTRPLSPQTLAQRYAAEKLALSHEQAVRQDFRAEVYTANAFYRRSVMDRVGLFDPAVTSGGDVDLAWRMQGRLGLRVAYCPRAVILHRHRETVAALLRQRRNYGYGSVLNYRKYREEMGCRTLKHTYWELRALERRLRRLLASGGAYLLALGRSAQVRHRLAVDWLDLLAFAATKWGQLEASIQHRVRYF